VPKPQQTNYGICWCAHGPWEFRYLLWLKRLAGLMLVIDFAYLALFARLFLADGSGNPLGGLLVGILGQWCLLLTFIVVILLRIHPFAGQRNNVDDTQ
jgi:hypothetical protein